MHNKKRGFFYRLTGGVHMDDEEETKITHERGEKKNGHAEGRAGNGWMEEENDEMELTVDVYQTPTDIILQTMVAGVRPEDIEIEVARDLITIRGKREESRTVDEDNYFVKELYWGKFSRTVLLPQEVDPEEVEATERHGLLTIKIKKVDKDKKNSIKIKSI